MNVVRLAVGPLHAERQHLSISMLAKFVVDVCQLTEREREGTPAANECAFSHGCGVLQSYDRSVWAEQQIACAV